MGRLDTITSVINLAKTIHDAVIAAKDERGRREKEKREAADEQKDRKIRALEDELKRAKETKT